MPYVDSCNISMHPMTLEDIPAVYAIETAAHEFSWTEGILSDCIKVGYECWVLQVNEEPLAHIIMSLGPGECHILNVCVKPSAQRQGYAQRLIAHVLEIARKNQAENAYLEVRAENIPAIKLYKKLGFEEVGIRKDYYPAQKGREDGIILTLVL